MRERYDVMVVGARVGGSALAALLGDQGVPVLLIDRGRGPARNYARVPWGRAGHSSADAVMHQDPWSGLGIDMAGVHAAFLADAIVDWVRGSADERTAFARYHQRGPEPTPRLTVRYVPVLLEEKG